MSPPRRLPGWFLQEIPDETTAKMTGLIRGFGLTTVCQEAKCPNITQCFGSRKATFMILGAQCTRNCRFCAVNKSKGAALGVDNDEPYRIAQAVKALGLSYVVITSVTRDDLPDAGAKQFAKTLELISSLNKEIKIEVLIPDFKAELSSLQCILDVCPSVAAHNIETVSRLYPEVRPQADYQRSLDVLGKIKELSHKVNTKSSLMLGFGESKEEVLGAMQDLRSRNCDILTLGQYLAPSPNHYPVKEFIGIQQFQEYRSLAIAMGFKAVFSGPKVRSSYMAEELQRELIYA